MKVSIMQERLAEVLKVCNKVVDRAHWKIAGKILLETKDARLNVVITDLETTISMWVGAKIDVEGNAVMPAKTLIDSVISMLPERLDMTLDARTMAMNLKCGKTVTNIKGYLPEEYPHVVTEGETALLIEGKYLYQAIQQTAFAVCKDSSRPPITGVNFDVTEESIGITALDGYRVCHTDIGVTNFLHLKENFTVPVGTVAIVGSRLGSDPNVEVLVSRVGNHVIFTIGKDATVSGVLLEDKYPEWQNVIPKEALTVVRIHGEELELACKRVKVMTSKDHAKVSVKIGNGILTLFSESAELGDASDTISAAVQGAEGEFMVSLPFLADPSVSGPLDISYAGEKKPIMLSTDDWLYLIMPLSSSNGG